MKASIEKFKRQKRLYLILPVMFAPFLVMLFWALGGGKGVYVEEPETNEGLNTQVPNAKLPETAIGWDKLTLYQQAQKDSLKKAEAERTDPYFRLKTMTENGEKDSMGFVNHSLGEKAIDVDSNELAINRRIDQINKAISQPTSHQPYRGQQQSSISTHEAETNTEDVDRLEEMMLMMQGDAGADPEMAQIEGVLEKILDVQHPERVREKLKEESAKTPGKVYSVVPHQRTTSPKFFGGRSAQNDKPSNDFHTISNGDYQDQTNTIQAVVFDRQTLQAGSSVKLKISDDIYLNGKVIPHGSFLFGACDLQNDRMMISVTSILINNSIFTVNLAAFDLDGQEGLYIPGTVANDAKKEVTNQAMQDLQMMSVDPSIGAQAAAAGIQTAKTLIGKKTRIVKVQVESGYKLFLKDKNTKE
jgi:conjugative transposon TraM protein